MKRCFREFILNSLRQNDAEQQTRRFVTDSPSVFSAQNYQVVAIGKAAAAMLSGLDGLFEKIDRALVITPEHYLLPQCKLANVEIIESSHPLPDVRSLYAGKRLVQFIHQSTSKHWVFLISGGASACVEQLPSGISLETLSRLNQRLISSHLNIQQINAVRKSYSTIKNGGLLNVFSSGSQIVQLTLSDVMGDRPCDVGSGLLFFDDAEPELPQSVRQLMHNNLTEAIDDRNDITINEFCVGNSLVLAEAVAQSCKIPTRSIIELNSTLDESFRRIKSILDSNTPGLHLFHGESTLELPSSAGRGGRNLHLALKMAEYLSGISERKTFIAVGTDGVDGNSRVAGALVDNNSWKAMVEKGIDPKLQLEQFNSYTALNAIDAVIEWPAGRTNVRDLIVLIIE